MPDWARTLAGELARLDTITAQRRSPAPPPAERSLVPSPPPEPEPALVCMAIRSLPENLTGIRDGILAPPPPCFEPPVPNFEPAPAQLRPPPPSFEPVAEIERELALERRLHPPHHEPAARGH